MLTFYDSVLPFCCYHPPASRAVPSLIESRNRSKLLFDRISLNANRPHSEEARRAVSKGPPPDQARGHASLGNALIVQFPGLNN